MRLHYKADLNLGCMSGPYYIRICVWMKCVVRMVHCTIMHWVFHLCNFLFFDVCKVDVLTKFTWMMRVMNVTPLWKFYLIESNDFKVITNCRECWVSFVLIPSGAHTGPYKGPYVSNLIPMEMLAVFKKMWESRIHLTSQLCVILKLVLLILRLFL